MSEMNPIEREQKKKQLRGRVIDTATQDMFPRRGCLLYTSDAADD